MSDSCTCVNVIFTIAALRMHACFNKCFNFAIESQVSLCTSYHSFALLAVAEAGTGYGSSAGKDTKSHLSNKHDVSVEQITYMATA